NRIPEVRRLCEQPFPTLEGSLAAVDGGLNSSILRAFASSAPNRTYKVPIWVALLRKFLLPKAGHGAADPYRRYSVASHLTSVMACCHQTARRQGLKKVRPPCWRSTGCVLHADPHGFHK